MNEPKPSEPLSSNQQLVAELREGQGPFSLRCKAADAIERLTRELAGRSYTTLVDRSDYDFVVAERDRLARLVEERHLEVSDYALWEKSSRENERLRAALERIIPLIEHHNHWLNEKGGCDFCTAYVIAREALAGAADETSKSLDSRDAIIEDVKRQSFSIRRVFYDYLDSLRKRSPEGYTVAWPDALQVLTLTEWNDAYQHALETRDSRRLPENGEGSR